MCGFESSWTPKYSAVLATFRWDRNNHLELKNHGSSYNCCYCWNFRSANHQDDCFGDRELVNRAWLSRDWEFSDPTSKSVQDCSCSIWTPGPEFFLCVRTACTPKLGTDGTVDRDWCFPRLRCTQILKAAIKLAYFGLNPVKPVSLDILMWSLWASHVV